MYVIIAPCLRSLSLSHLQSLAHIFAFARSDGCGGHRKDAATVGELQLERSWQLNSATRCSCGGVEIPPQLNRGVLHSEALLVWVPRVHAHANLFHCRKSSKPYWSKTPRRITCAMQDVEDAITWINSDLNLSGAPDVMANLFETSIRIVGGLLASAHLLHGDRRLLRPATELSLRLLCAFNTPSGIPFSDVALANIEASHPLWTTSSSLSEATTLSLEFSQVARVTHLMFACN
jgi:hypothetical protein